MSDGTDSEGGIFHRLMSRGWFMQPKAAVGPLAPRSREKSLRGTPVAKNGRYEDLLVVLAQTDSLPELLQGQLPVDWHSRTFGADELRALIKSLNGATVYDAALFGVQVDGIEADELKTFVKNLKLQWQADHAAELKLTRAQAGPRRSDPSSEGSRAARTHVPKAGATEPVLPPAVADGDKGGGEGQDNGPYFVPRTWRTKL